MKKLVLLCAVTFSFSAFSAGVVGASAYSATAARGDVIGTKRAVGIANVLVGTGIVEHKKCGKGEYATQCCSNYDSVKKECKEWKPCCVAGIANDGKTDVFVSW